MVDTRPPLRPYCNDNMSKAENGASEEKHCSEKKFDKVFDGVDNIYVVDRIAVNIDVSPVFGLFCSLTGTVM